eukprot:9475335-Pyramimonas_sp.AAC.1
MVSKPRAGALLEPRGPSWRPWGQAHDGFAGRSTPHLRIRVRGWQRGRAAPSVASNCSAPLCSPQVKPPSVTPKRSPPSVAPQV